MLNLKDDEGNNVLHIAVSTSQPQIVKLLVGTCLNKNAKNWEGLTALDIAAKLGPGPAKIEIENILCCAGVSKSSSLPNNNNIYSQANFLMSPEGFSEAVVGWMLHLRSFWSLEKPYMNMVLVVAVLLATATYQAVLSPPGGGVIGHNVAAAAANNNNLLPVPGDGGVNISSPTSTSHINPSDDSFYFYLFYNLNTSTFMCSIIVIMVVLHLRPFGLLLQTFLGCLTMSYGLSFHFISPSQSYAKITLSLVISIIPCVSLALSVFKSERYEMLHRCFMNCD